MKKTYKNKILEHVNSLGIPVAGIAGDGATYSKIVCLFPYYTGVVKAGNLSMYAHGKDYHSIVRKYLEKIAAFLQELCPSASAEIHVDIGTTDDKRSAYEAGLGFYGKNTLLYHPEYGSWFFIGYVKTDLILPPDTPLETSCADCGMCENACPGNALQNGRLEIENCASHISQKKGELTSRETEILIKSGKIWGCDKCQTVCPLNVHAKKTPLPEFYEDILPSLSDLPESNKAFSAMFGDRAFSWRGPSPIKRNLEILSLHEKETGGHTM